jgi:peptidoglycan/LPS O-acetylase OafA/YrhL
METTTPTTTERSTAPRTDGRLLPLDGLRTVAILAVIAYHLHLPGSTGGFLGVQVFFVLSGYLITTLLIRERRRTGRIRLGRFSVRRVLRLYPALVAMIVVGVLLWPIVGDYKGASLSAGSAAGISLTYTGNLFRAFWHTSQGVFAQTWSLATEEQFYLVWPTVLVVIALLRVRRWAIVAGLLSAVVGCAVLAQAVYVTPGGGATANVYFNPLLGAATLLTGCALAITLDDDRVRAAVSGPIGRLATWVGLAVLVAVAVTMPADWTRVPTTFGVTIPVAGLAAALLVGGLVTTDTWIARGLSIRPVSWFGRRVSYSAYLWHPLVIALLTPLLVGTWGKVSMIAVALLVATAATFAVEVPVERLRARLRLLRAARAEEARDRVDADRVPVPA